MDFIVRKKYLKKFNLTQEMKICAKTGNYIYDNINLGINNDQLFDIKTQTGLSSLQIVLKLWEEKKLEIVRKERNKKISLILNS
jgi:hypothetical protein